MRKMSKCWFGLFFCMIFAASPAFAEDFSPRSWEWNGTARFLRVLREQGTQVEVPKTFDWSRARLQDPILILAPTREGLDLRPLLIFLAAGGRVFLADDFGTSRPWMHFFGLDQQRGAYNAKVWQLRRYIDVHVTHPVRSQKADLLLRQSSTLFLNHPQWLRSIHTRDQYPLLVSSPHFTNVPDGFRPGLVLFRTQIGYGTLVVFSDPSALINEMIPYGDNLRFAHNLARYLKAPAQSGKVTLLVGDFSWKNEPSLPFSQLLWGALQLTWEWFAEANKSLTSEEALQAAFPPISPAALRSGKDPYAFSAPKPPASRWLFVYLLVGAIFFVMWWGWARFASGTAPNQRYDREREELLRLIPERFSEQLESYREGHLSYLWPMIILREEVVLFLVDHFHLSDRLGQRDPRESVGLVLDLIEEDLRQERIEASLAQVLPRLRQILTRLPGRHQWNEWLHRNVGAHELRMAYHDVLHCLQQVGMDQKFRHPFLKRPTAPHFADAKITPPKIQKRTRLQRWFSWLFRWFGVSREPKAKPATQTKMSSK
ncbi:MAG: DUF4350 domain-containing protein [Myxococcales bacterium]|nr:DUF4350 domain-containing protein [Myxococcales bacterium]MCB9642065.1 DUF4350 domain-containing protein [Myxococcales bacterium]